MPAQAQSHMQVIRKEEKEAKLRDFLLTTLEALPGTSHRPHKISVVARSLESPVFKAIAGLAPELSAAGCAVEVILTLMEGPAATLDLGRLDIALRQATNPRLIDAHEQMILSPDSVWIGDCMRRDPSKRDAFELFTRQGGTTAKWAHTSFERLWQRGEPIDVQCAALAIEGQSIAEELAPTVTVELVPATVSSRH